MQVRKRLPLVAAAGICVATCLSGGFSFAAIDGAPWGYSGANGPENWGSLDPAYAACAQGTMQSPIDFTKTSPASMKAPIFRYGIGKATVFDNGHSFEAMAVDPSADNSVTLGGKDYALVQFHFHAPSEHTVNGKHYPLEVHFVNKANDVELAVFGVLVKQGAPASTAWSKVASNLNKARTDGKPKTVMSFDWNTLIPSMRDTYRYSGSITTPPCTEGVKFNIFSKPITMSTKQIDAFVKAHDGNNRPVQPLNGRVVLRASASNS